MKGKQEKKKYQVRITPKNKYHIGYEVEYIFWISCFTADTIQDAQQLCDQLNNNDTPIKTIQMLSDITTEKPITLIDVED